MTANELREKSVPDLLTKLGGLLREQFNLRVRRGSRQDVRPHLFKQTRKSIARVKTLIAEKTKEGGTE